MSASGVSIWIPVEHYACAGIQKALERILADSTVLEATLTASTQRSEEGELCEVWDGQMWNDEPWKTYFATTTNLGLQFYVDWFQPFKRTVHSTGSIFLTIMNLPVDLRYK